MLSRVLAVLEVSDQGVTPLSLEVLALAQGLSRQAGASLGVTFAVPEEGRLAAVPTLAADQVIALVDPTLGEYTPEPYLEALSGVLRETAPDLALFPHSYQNMDLTPRLAARLGVPLVTDCVSCRLDSGGLVFTRQVFRNKLNADVRLRGKHPWLATLQAGAFSADQWTAGSTRVEVRHLRLPGGQSRWTLRERVETCRRKVDLAKAEVIIGVGRGIRNQENLAMVRELAQLLGAEIGASRPVVDNGWLERDRQVGSSGQTVAPRLYLALGISGAIQHVVGIRNSGCIVAVNSDPNAPIFNLARYGIVGDVAAIVPALIKALRGGEARVADPQ